jgi:hypothetical protein
LTLLVLLLGGFAAWRLLKLVARMLQRAGRHRRRRVAHSLQVASAKARLAAGTRNTAPPLGAIATARPVDVPPPPFELAVHQNRYLLGGGVDVDAIVTVTCEGAAEAAVEAAEVILVDRSGSMAYPLDKLRGARRATAAAIDALREGTWFAVVRATDTAQPLFPRAGLVEATPESKAQAKKALRLLWAEGGTALGKWLLMADDLLTARPYAIRHAILLTDGRNENESEEELDAALAACRGRFQCDCRGVGTDWEVGELRRIASAMVGTVDIVAEPAQLEDDFRALVERAMAKRTRDVTLRLWTPRGAEVRFVRQVSPQIETLAECVGGAGPLLTDVSTGAWSEETRAYHVSLRVPGHEPGEDMLAGAVSVLVDGLVVGRALIRATWTEDAGVAAEIAPELAHYRSQTELASSIRMGLEARREGDDRRATVMLGRAVRLAAESGNDATMRLLERLVEVEDPATGRVCLRGGVDDADEMALDTRSTRSVPIGARAP